jgi:hypothetical protein
MVSRCSSGRSGKLMISASHLSAIFLIFNPTM